MAVFSVMGGTAPGKEEAWRQSAYPSFYQPLLDAPCKARSARVSQPPQWPSTLDGGSWKRGYGLCATSNCVPRMGVSGLPSLPAVRSVELSRTP